MSEHSSQWIEAGDPADGEEGDESFGFILYVAGLSSLSRRAIVNTRELCEKYLPGRYELEVVDLSKDPHLAMEKQIIAAPTLLKRLPLPERRFVGDMSRTSVILKGLGVADPNDLPNT